LGDSSYNIATALLERSEIRSAGDQNALTANMRAAGTVSFFIANDFQQRRSYRLQTAKAFSVNPKEKRKAMILNVFLKS
jgi:hypothetical protein